jgi:hypothetical protein
LSHSAWRGQQDVFRSTVIKKEEKIIMRRIVFLLAAAAILSAGTASASRDNDEYEDREHSRSAKFYGVVDALPQTGLDGIWQVNGRQVMVTRATEIKEKRGKVAVGSYVKVEGYPSGSSFTADEIEVKGSRH